MSTFVPLEDRVVIRRETIKNPTSSIVLPDSFKQDVTQGVVEAVGPGVCDQKTGKFTSTVLKPGATILFARGTGMGLTHNGIDYIIMRECDIVGVVSEV